MAAYVELTKPGITRLVALTSAAGFYLGSGGDIDLAALLHTVLGTAAASSAACAINEYLERDADARMLRTRRRPLPSGRLSPPEALAFAVTLAVASIAYLWATVGPVCAILVALTLASYDFVYTPLKRVSSLSTLVGAVPGALPVLAGWVGAGGSLTAPGGWALFGIVFLWQIPHFLALAWMFRDDYRRGGFVMLSLADPDGSATAIQSINYAFALTLVSLAPTLLGLTGTIYLVGAVVLGGTLLASSTTVFRRRTDRSARRLFLASVLYLPALLILMVVDKLPR
ncbi:MAG: protoheme IX farnesyltransferase [Gemmatimonadetes bacterium]|nr:protoheme IX farnesyltransferase [Gemmatimonadota bacterium]